MYFFSWPKIYSLHILPEIVVVKIKCFNTFSGFRMNPSSWPSFLQKTLTGAVVASDSCFKKVIIKIVFHSYDLHTENNGYEITVTGKRVQRYI